MVSIPSALMLLVVVLAGAMSPARAMPLTWEVTASAPAHREIRLDDANRDAGWRQAVRTDVACAARVVVSKRDGGPDRRERAAGAGFAWIPLERTAAHASRVASLALRERAPVAGAPGLPAPSSRAPPTV
jgi:hypothetical protein